ncbi:MAG: extracellular solute-binding protein [Acidiferrobacteraceae bacterium]
MNGRRAFLQALAVAALASGRQAAGAELAPLQVAYAGSMGALMDEGVRPAVARDLGIALRGRGQGAFALARLIAAGSIRPDVFISITPAPMSLLLSSGHVRRAIPVARTEMVIAYSGHGRFSREFASVSSAGTPWWRLLETPSLRFGRTDPRTDPQGLNIVFLMELAQQYYHVPGFARRVLGPLENPRQIFPEADVMARLQSAQLDAASAYKTQPSSFALPFVPLPPEINLGDARMAARYRQASVTLNGIIHRPQPLVFYAAVLRNAHDPGAAERFIAWLLGPDGRSVFARYHYDAPTGASPLVPAEGRRQ